MNNKTCSSCNWHTVFIEENGEWDGCTCDNEKDTIEYHMNNCLEYISDLKDFKSCPYWKERND